MSEKYIKTRLLQRTDTSTNWNNSSLVLKAGEIGYESDTHKMKVGDGSHSWIELSYVNPINLENGTGEGSLQQGGLWNGHIFYNGKDYCRLSYEPKENFLPTPNQWGTAIEWVEGQADFILADAVDLIAHPELAFTANYYLLNDIPIDKKELTFGKVATGESSFAAGKGTIAAGNAQFVGGKYNIEDTTSLVIIGNGTNNEHRANALVLSEHGDLRVSNSILSKDIYLKNGLLGKYNDQWWTILSSAGNGNITLNSVKGDLFLGNKNTNNIYLGASILDTTVTETGLYLNKCRLHDSIIPFQKDFCNLGEEGCRWNNLYIRAIVADTINVTTIKQNNVLLDDTYLKQLTPRSTETINQNSIALFESGGKAVINSNSILNDGIFQLKSSNNAYSSITLQDSQYWAQIKSSKAPFLFNKDVYTYGSVIHSQGDSSLTANLGTLQQPWSNAYIKTIYENKEKLEDKYMLKMTVISDADITTILNS